MIMFKKIYTNFAISFSSLTFIWMLMHVLMPKIFNILFLYSLLILCFTNTILAFLLFQEKMGYKKLWFHRSILILVDSLTMSSLVLFFKIVEFKTAWGCIRFYAYTLIGNLILSSVLYWIADSIEKKTLEKINRNLKENTDD